MTAAPKIDSILAEAIRDTACDLAAAIRGGPASINERDYLKPILHTRLSYPLGPTVHKREPRLHFDHWQGPAEVKLGGIDIAVHRDDGSGYRAFLELKWDHPDWMILDFYKMTTARLSPGADSCYLVAGQPVTEWAKPGSECELFRTATWRSENTLRRHYKAFRGDEREYGKLTHLPSHIHTTLVADETLPVLIDKKEWAIKAIRVEPDPLDDTDWLHIKNGEIIH